MARPLRVEYKGAFYHVTSRGNEKKEIFSAPEDYEQFKTYLYEAREKKGYCDLSFEEVFRFDESSDWRHVRGHQFFGGIEVGQAIFPAGCRGSETGEENRGAFVQCQGLTPCFLALLLPGK